MLSLAMIGCNGRWNDEPTDKDAGAVKVRLSPALATAVVLGCQAWEVGKDEVVVRVDVIEWRTTDRHSSVNVVLEVGDKRYAGTVDLALGSTEVRGLDGEVLGVPRTPDLCDIGADPTS